MMDRYKNGRPGPGYILLVDKASGTSQLYHFGLPQEKSAAATQPPTNKVFQYHPTINYEPFNFLAELMENDREGLIDMEQGRLVLSASEQRMDAKKVMTAEEKQILEAQLAFTNSLTNTYPNLKIEVTGVEIVPNTRDREAAYETLKRSIASTNPSEEELQDRWVFHTTPNERIRQAICETTLRPSGCAKCKESPEAMCSDPGWFGDHTQGVYGDTRSCVCDVFDMCVAVSKHADYTFFYQRTEEVKAGDAGSVIIQNVHRKTQAAQLKTPPTPGFHCHESPTHLEYYVFNPVQVVPKFVVHWRAIDNKRAGKVHDQ